jgi:hypothetical protein
MLNKDQLKKLMNEQFSQGHEDDDIIADKEAQKFMIKKAPRIIEQAILLVRDLKAANNLSEFDRKLDHFIRWTSKQLGRHIEMW